MMTLLIIAALAYAVYKLHKRLMSVDEDYAEQAQEDEAKAAQLVEKLRRKATEFKEWLF